MKLWGRSNTILLASLILLTACGGGSDKKSDPATGDKEPGGGTPVVQTGVFIDSPVANLGYRTPSQGEGRTNEQGEFQYLPGEEVTFFIGGLDLPPVLGARIVTPLDMGSEPTRDDPVVTNILRLLQSLDTDTEDDRITLSDDVYSVEVELPAGLDSPEFTNEIEALIQLATGGARTSLIDENEAWEHFQASLGQIEESRSTGFDPSDFKGTVYSVYAEDGKAYISNLTFDPATGKVVATDGDGSGTNMRAAYKFESDNKVIQLNFTTGPNAGRTHFVVFDTYDVTLQAYRICWIDDSDITTPEAALLEVETDEEPCSQYVTTGLGQANNIKNTLQK